MFDDKLHQMDSLETQDLFYFFKYVKKNLFLIAAIEMVPGLYEDQLEYRFLQMHQKITKCVRRNVKDYDLLTRALTIELATSMKSINRINSNNFCKDDLDGAFNDQDLETDNIESTLSLSSKSWNKLTNR